MAWVEVNGQRYDPNILDDQNSLFEMGFEYRAGQWIDTQSNVYVAQSASPPVPTITAAATGIGNTVLGNTIQNPAPGIMINAVLAGVWSGFNPNDIAGGLAIIRAYSLDVYGSVELGVVRYSSEVLENEPTGVRPGIMERIVIPAWARRERGSPL